MSRSPSFDGIVGHARGVWTDSYDYVVPRDLSSRILTRRGFDVVLTIPGQGLVMLDAGTWAVDFDGNVLFAHGPHPALEGIEGEFATACDPGRPRLHVAARLHTALSHRKVVVRQIRR